MIERVDAGPIVDTALFSVPEGISLLGLEELAYASLAKMFWRYADRLANEAAPLPERQLLWAARKNTRSTYKRLCDIPLDISSEELKRRMRVFGGNHFGIAPSIHLHGVEFRAVSDERR